MCSVEYLEERENVWKMNVESEYIYICIYIQREGEIDEEAKEAQVCVSTSTSHSNVTSVSVRVDSSDTESAPSFMLLNVHFSILDDTLSTRMAE